MSSILRKFVRKVVLWSISQDLLEFALEVDKTIVKHNRGLLSSVENLDYDMTVLLSILKDKGLDFEKDSIEILH